MRTILALALMLSYLTGLLVAGDEPDVDELMAVCMSENSVSNQDFVDLKSGVIRPENAKDNMKCATQCLMVKLGYMDGQGKVLADSIKAKFVKTPLATAVDDALATCGGIKGVNPCDTAFQIMICLENKYKTVGTMMST